MSSPITKITPCSKRIDALKAAVQNTKPGVCTERAMIWTRYFKARENQKKPPTIQIAVNLESQDNGICPGWLTS